jgi:hypothetical protein
LIRDPLINWSTGQLVNCCSEPMKHRFINWSPVSQVLDHNPFEQLWRDTRVPDAFRIDNDNRAAGADSEARRFAAFHPRGTKKKSFAFE